MSDPVLEVVPEETSDQVTPVIETRELGRWYGEVVGLSDLSVVIQPGITGLVGPNGSGKSTFMKLIVGELKPSRGGVRVLGHQPFANRELYRDLGFCPQQDALYDHLSAHGFLDHLLRITGMSAGESKQRAERALGRVGLTESMHRKCGTYSKGMRQRLGLAQALLGKPELLLLDEPTTGLDPDFTRTFYRLIDERRQAGAAVILSSHALAELEPHVDRLLVLQQGKCIAQGDLSALRVQTGLPVRIRVSGDDGAVREKLADLADVQSNRINGRTVEFICPPEQKMALIELVCRTRGVEDLQIELPNLDRIYSHYSKQGNTGKAEGGTEQ